MKSRRAQLNAREPSQLMSADELFDPGLGSKLVAETPTAHLRQTRPKTLSLVHHRQAYGYGVGIFTAPRHALMRSRCCNSILVFLNSFLTHAFLALQGSLLYPGYFRLF